MVKLFQNRRFLPEEKTSDLVLNIQFEILKLISEKDDLIKENKVLKHYRQSCMKLQKENSQLREKLELLEVVPSVNRKQERDLNSLCLSRTSPDGQEETDKTGDNASINNCDVRSIENRLK